MLSNILSFHDSPSSPSFFLTNSLSLSLSPVSSLSPLETVIATTATEATSNNNNTTTTITTTTAEANTEGEGEGGEGGGEGEWMYELLAVLVHSGGSLGGHYFAYIKVNCVCVYAYVCVY